MIAPFLIGSIILFFPLAWILEQFSKLFQRGKRKIGTEAQIKSLVTLGRQAGYLEVQESRLIKKILNLNRKTARQIMIPAKRVVALKMNDSIEESVQVALASEFTRFPVLDHETNQVQGFVISHNLLKALHQKEQKAPINTLLLEPLRIDPAETLNKVLKQFRCHRVHLAVIEDKREFKGILTLEDVLEQILGPILDEREK